MRFADIDVHPALKSAVMDMGFEELTEIQERCLGPGQEGKDIAGISQTGTGKTVAFLMPILDRLFKEDELASPAALIVTPTRELCTQIAEEAEKLTAHHSLQICCIYGGTDYKSQEAQLAKKPAVIVATPGRLIDYMKQNKIDAGHLKFLVLDEADRMFDMGFIRDVRYIMRHVPRESQTFLFSATLSYYIMRLASDFMDDPVEVRVESESVAVDKIDQTLLHLGREEREPYLIQSLLSENEHRAIVFTNYKQQVRRLVDRLRRYGIRATGISSLLDQKKRLRLLKDFKVGRYSVLVATDVASRGLDVDDVTHVYNYDLPQDAESYVHRIGRTARAGKSGTSVSFCSESDYENLPRIQRYVGQKLPVGQVNEEFVKYPEGKFEPFVAESLATREEEERDQREGSGNREGRARRNNRGRRDQREEREKPDRPASAEQDSPEEEVKQDVGTDRPMTVREMDRQAVMNRQANRSTSDGDNQDQVNRSDSGGKRRRRRRGGRGKRPDGEKREAPAAQPGSEAEGSAGQGEGRSRRRRRNRRNRRGSEGEQTESRPNSDSSNNDNNRNQRGGRNKSRGGGRKNESQNRSRQSRNNAPPKKEEKKGLFAKIKSIFKSD